MAKFKKDDVVRLTEAGVFEFNDWLGLKAITICDTATDFVVREECHTPYITPVQEMTLRSLEEDQLQDHTWAMRESELLLVTEESSNMTPEEVEQAIDALAELGKGTLTTLTDVCEAQADLNKVLTTKVLAQELRISSLERYIGDSESNQGDCVH